jgi:hypothetical protein
MAPTRPASTPDPISEPTAEPEKTGPRTVEFVGVPPYGRAFHGSRTITKAQAKKAFDVSLDKDIVFDERGDWKISAEGLPEKVLAYFAKDPAFQVS